MLKEVIKMAEQTTKKASVKEIESEPLFTVATLRDNCNELFNCSTAIFDGATFDIADNSLYSISELSAVIDKFKNKKL